ncbi:radical SAM protein [Spirillospora sp. NPDC052242]
MYKSVDPSWVPLALPELTFRQRGEYWLALNPTVPAWFVTNYAGALLLQLADGSRAVADIHRLIVDFGIDIELGHVTELFESAKKSLLFSAGRQSENEWGSQQLAAVHLHLTNRCNLQCTYCFRESSPGLPIHYTADHFIDALHTMKPFATENLKITFTGGEPMMFPGFESVVEASTECGYTNLLLTNGMLISPERAEFIAQHFSSITISLDGPTEEVHSATRGRGNHKRVLQGIRRLADAGAKVHVKVTVSPDNLPYCDQVAKVLPDTVPVQFTPMMPMGRGQELHRDFIDNDAFVGLNRGLARATDGRMSTSYMPGHRSRRCHAGLFNISIADTGDVYPCHLFHQDQFKLGNIFTQPFGEIFFGEQNRSYVKTMDVEANNDICRSCEVRFLCGGGCKANTLHSIGDYRGVDRYCGYIKTTITDDLFRSCGVAVEPVDGMEVETLTGRPESTFLGMPSMASKSTGTGGGIEMTTSA